MKAATPDGPVRHLRRKIEDDPAQSPIHYYLLRAWVTSWWQRKENEVENFTQVAQRF